MARIPKISTPLGNNHSIILVLWRKGNLNNCHNSIILVLWRKTNSNNCHNSIILVLWRTRNSNNWDNSIIYAADDEEEKSVTCPESAAPCVQLGEPSLNAPQGHTDFL